jgi:CRP/FNR family transcriptional regulator, cyclic AMP receptor protein
MTRHPELFAGLSDASATALEALGSRISLAPGHVLFRIGDDASHLYVIERGAIELRMPMQVEGHDEDVRIEECPAGHTLGWSTLVPPHRFTLEASARLHTELLAFPRDALLAYFSSHPDVGYVVLRNIAAVLGQRLQVFQAMWVRQMQHIVDLTNA